MRAVVTFVFLPVVALAALAASGAETRIPNEHYVLANGLNVILHVDRSDPIAAVYVSFHVGSAREKPGRTGFAHLFEHLRFNESQHIPQGQWFKKLQTAGATSVNGTTNNDRTNYFQVVPRNAVELALWMESDRMGYLLSKLTVDAFVTQQNVVQNEKRQNDNAPYSQTGTIIDRLLYPEDHPYHWPVIGSLEDLATASLKDVVEFHNAYYGPSNATLVVSGDIDVTQTKAWIEKYFGEIPSSNKPAPLPKMPVRMAATKRAVFEDPFASAPQLTIAFPAVEDSHSDAPALSFLSRVLGGSRKSPLYRIIVEERKLAASVSARPETGELAGKFLINIRAFPGTKLADVEAAVDEALTHFEREGFSDVDVERQKAGVEFRTINSVSSVLGKAMRLADDNMFRGRPDMLDADLKASLAVTAADVHRAYDRYLRGRPRVILSTVPRGKTELAAANSEPITLPEESIDQQGVRKRLADTPAPAPIPSSFDRSKEPSLGPDPVSTMPAIWTGALSNGVPVFGVTQRELPVVQFSVTMRGGMMLDEPLKTGTGMMVARMLNEGTRSKTPVELREAIEDLGATLTVTGSEGAVVINGFCLTQRLDATVALALEMLLEPRWDENMFGLLKTQTLDAIKRSEASPTMIASRVFDRLLYGEGHILARPATGTSATVASMTLEDLKSWYARNVSPSTARVVVLGDIDREASLAAFRHLGMWKSTGVAMPAIAEPSGAAPGLYFVDVPKARQSVILAGHLGPVYTDPDYFKAVAMNHRLGGDFNSILNSILRETKSYTYSVRSSFTGTDLTGVFVVNTSVQANATYESLQIIRDAIASYRDGISAEELQQVQSTLLRSSAGRFETLPRLGLMVAPVVLYGLSGDYLAKREADVRAMTVSEHRGLARRYLRPDRMIYVVVGDKASQFDRLSDLGLGHPILLDANGAPATH